MIDQHPITPPPDLLKYWEEQHFDEGENYDVLLIDAYQKGADMELQACCNWLPKLPPWSADDLRKHRRPKPPSLKEQALVALERWAEDEHGPGAVFHKGLEVGLIRRALEALDD